jgi:hypothetical protein
VASEGYYTKFSNYVFDHIMPELSPAAFKVLMFIIRRTLGWRKECDEISYSQFMEGTGIGSEHTIKKAIDELDSKGYIKVDRDRGVSNFYSINTQVLSVTTTVESAEDTTAQSAEDGGGTSAESADTKESGRKPSVSNDEDIAVTELQRCDKFPDEYKPNIQMIRRIAKDYPKVNVIMAVSSAVNAIDEGEKVRSPYGFLRYYFKREDALRKKSWEEQYADANIVN